MKVFSDAVMERVRRMDIVKYIGRYIPQLRPASDKFLGLCPFCKRGYFLLHRTTNLFECLGCGEGGGIIKFFMLQFRLSFVESVQRLCRLIAEEN